MPVRSQARDPGATWAHVVPFVAWLALQFLLGEPAAWKYAVRAGTSLALLAWLKPWTWYPALNPRHLLAALAAGAVVFGLWVVPEAEWTQRYPALRAFYDTWLVMPLGKFPEYSGGEVYAPSACGWALTLTRLLGSALVIAVAEEFFWRGFFYRWLVDRDFTRVDPGLFHLGIFLAVSLVFGLEHNRWFAGLLAGCVYAGLYIRTRDIWAAAVAHVTTNLLLGLYVLACGAYRFW